MNKQFPPELLAFWRQSNAIKCFVSTPEGNYANKCDNCGGAGFFVGSIAIAGPFDSPLSPANVYHYHDGKWWSVINKSADCPVCHNGKTAVRAATTYKPVQKSISNLTSKLTREEPQ